MRGPRRQSTAMHADFKLLKVVDGICHFARVHVVAEPRLSGLEVVEELDPAHSTDDGEVDRRREPGWIDAAVSGITECGAALLAAGHVSGGKVCLKGVAGTVVDTTADDVRCAAYLAAWQALAPGLALPEYAHHNGTWRFTPKAAT
jgi:hypothetical protein